MIGLIMNGSAIWINLGVDKRIIRCYSKSIIRKQKEGKMADIILFESNPRDYALELVEQGYSAEEILTMALKFMSSDDVKEMLDVNELSPRFLEDEYEDDGQPSWEQEWEDFGEVYSDEY